MSCTATTDCTLLLIDDEEPNLDLLEAFLGAEGFHSLVRTSDARQAIPLFDSCKPDLVLLDLHMPYRNGFEVLHDIRERTPPGDYLPVLILTADITPESKERALSNGARDFLTKPFDAVEVLLRVENLLETRLLHRLQCEARARAEAAERRTALLAEASQVLGASLDTSTTLSQLTRLLVPRLADGCVLTLRNGDSWSPAAVAHMEPEREAALGAALSGSGFAALVADAVGSVQAGNLRPIAGAGGLGTAGPGMTVVAPLRSQGQPVGALILVREGSGREFDLHEVALAEEIAARAALAVENAGLFADAQRARRAQERMMSVVAHDLRNPLTVVGMYAEMLQSMLPPEGDDEYQREALDSIHQCATRMQHLIEDLLDVTRMEQGTFRLERAALPVPSLFEAAEKLLRPLAEAHRIEIMFRGEVEEPSRPIEVDADRFVQVVSNLVGNALKFTPEEGRVTISWAAAGTNLQVSVADTGAGIPADQLPDIFGAFWQAGEADRNGVGLGLWITRTIVEAHGGRIWVDSREGEGTIFHFTLPWWTDAAIPVPPIASRDPSLAGS